jgi:hypothetical protein
MYSFEVDQKNGAKIEKIRLNPMHVIFGKPLGNGVNVIALTGGTQIHSSSSYDTIAESLNAALKSA